MSSILTWIAYILIAFVPIIIICTAISVAIDKKKEKEQEEEQRSSWHSSMNPPLNFQLLSQRKQSNILYTFLGICQ